jgi:predicted dehydrogenase
VSSGDIGAVNDICVHMEFLYGATPAEAATWRCADPAQLGGPIGDVGCHCLYMAEFLLGARITRIGCVCTPPHMGLKVEEGADIRFLTDGGTWGSARVSFDSARGGGEGTLLNLGFEIYGSRGVIRSYGTMFQLSGHAGEPVPLRLEVDSFGSRETVTIPSPANIYQLTIARHAESARKGPPLGCEDGLHNLDLLLACHASAKDGGRMQEIASPVAS